jgi:predicted DNA-binding transcriptional regulator AlpA
MGARLLTEIELSKMLNVKPATIRQWRARATGPPYIRINARLIRYDRQVIEAWLERVAPAPPPVTVKANRYGAPKMPKMQMKRTRFNLGDID